jgi:hypothetical protein
MVLFSFISKYRAIQIPLLAGGLLRLIFAWLIGLRLVDIPGTVSDAVQFERLAIEWSELPWEELIRSFDPSRSFVISWLGAIIYKMTAPSPVLLNLINAVFSVWLIVLSYKLAKRLFGPDRARAAAWIVAFFPFGVLYGSVFRREVFGSVLFMLALFQSMDWARTHSPFRLFLALSCLGTAGTFHSGYAFGVIGLLAFASTTMILSFFRPGSERSANVLISGFLATFIAVSGLGVLVASGTNLNKIGELDSFSALESIEHRIAVRVSEGGSSYPDFLRGVDPFSNPLVIPGRVAYFLISPFPWDIGAPGHVLGLFATVYFFLILRSIIGARRLIISSREATIVLVITLSAVLVFAISIDNIGTSIRHRTKFVYPLAALCALPLFRRYRVSLKSTKARRLRGH